MDRNKAWRSGDVGISGWLRRTFRNQPSFVLSESNSLITHLRRRCAEQRFDVAIIGEAMSSKVKRWACQLIRENCPSARVLELHPPYAGKSLDDAYAWLAM